MDKIALQCRGISEEDVHAYPNSKDEINQLRCHVRQRQKTQNSDLSYFIRGQHLSNFNCCVSDPSVIIMADHDSLRGSCGSTCVDEGRTVAWLLHFLSVLDSILLFLWFVAKNNAFLTSSRQR